MAYQYKITVFTPTYNRAYIIEKLYASLCRQTYRNFEWLVVDDGSTDGTDVLFERLRAEADFPIQYFKKENGGKGRAIIPLLKAYQISPISENKPVYFLNNKGINSRLFSLTNHQRYTRWEAIFAILGLTETEGTVNGLMCYGRANGKNVDVMTIQRASGGDSFVRLQGYQTDGSYYDNFTQLADGAYPSFPVDVMF